MEQKIIISKKKFGLIGIVFGALGVVMFWPHRENMFAPVVISGIILTIGILDTLRYYRMEFDGLTKSYVIEKGWRVPAVMTHEKRGTFDDFGCVYVERHRGRDTGDYYSVSLKFKSGEELVPRLHNGCRYHKAQELAKKYSELLGLPLELSMPDAVKRNWLNQT